MGTARKVAGLLGAVLVAAVLAAPGAAAAAVPRGTGVLGAYHAWSGPGVVPGTLLVTTADTRARSRLGAVPGVRATRTLAAGVDLVTVPRGKEAAVAARLAAAPGVRAVEPNRLRAFTAVPDDPDFSMQWAHQLTGIQGAWDSTTGSHDVLVAVADSGTVASHPDLAGRVVEQVDASTGAVAPGSTDNDPCQVGHGTWVAGVVGGVGDNGVGITGVNWDVSILDINIADPQFCGPADAAIIASVDYARQREADIVNLSLGGPSSACPTALQTVLDQARAAGTLVVAAAGNGGDSGPQVPGSCNGVVSVAAVGSGGDRAGYSTMNPYVDVAAPGGSCSCNDPGADILTTSFYNGGDLTGETRAVAGTSFSSPYVAGLAALLLARDPSLTPDQLEAAIEGTAADRGAPGRDPAYGWGLVQAARAMDAVAVGLIPPLQEDPAFPVEDDPSGGGGVDVSRVAEGATTEAVGQAVAMSQATFDAGGARHVVIARRDDFADALAGSSVTFGVGPLLFTGSTGPLAGATRTELLRVLRTGSRVFLMGGTAALPATLEAELIALGYNPVRLAGETREHTAAAAAPVAAAFADNTLYDTGTVIVATRSNWPDAVAAGQLGAYWGMPILLTQHDVLPEPTRAALAELEPVRILVIGGTGVVSDAVVVEIGQVTGVGVERLGGSTRTGTAVAVAFEMEALFFNLVGDLPDLAIAVNLRRADGFAHVLSAAPLAGARGATFIPVEGETGEIVTDDVKAYACNYGADAVLAGATDLITDATGQQLGQLLAGSDPSCTALGSR